MTDARELAAWMRDAKEFRGVDLAKQFPDNKSLWYEFSCAVKYGIVKQLNEDTYRWIGPAQTAPETEGSLQKDSDQISGDIPYYDWQDNLPVLEHAYKAREFVLVIGPAGSGKTQLVRRFNAMLKRKVREINFSLRTRESHLVGTKGIHEGNTYFIEGILPQSMREGSTLYCDELSAAEPDVLIRLDEALDDRRQLGLKENDGEVVNAHPDWWVVATINPVTYAGVKELPAQIISRFPVRIYLKYPPPDVEMQIVKLHVKEMADRESVELAITLANKLRERADVGDIPYSPTIRETIAFTRLVNQGMNTATVATTVFANVYQQWGEIEAQKVNDLIVSLFGMEKGVQQ